MSRTVGYAEALSEKPRPQKQKKAELDHIRFVPAHVSEMKDAEGHSLHVVEHHMKSGDGPWREPEKHTFKQSEGKELIAHLKEHGKISEKEAPDTEIEEGE